MARLAGCSYPIWGHWEAGRTVPRYDDLERIAATIDDSRLRMQFWIDIYSESSTIEVTLRRAVTQREALILRYADDAMLAIRELSASAAEEQLRDLADRLVRAAKSGT